MRFHKIPRWLKRFYTGATWDFYDEPGKVIYLTFDDGPHPNTTPWLLDLLDSYNAKATFFCSGKQVAQHSSLYKELISRGHAVGNHGMQHISGFNCSTQDYMADVSAAAKLIDSKLFRPAYGKITRPQFRVLKQMGYRVVFWSFMPYDFDQSLNSEKRFAITLKNTRPGSILVFHDSEKAFPQLKQELPLLLKEWQRKGFNFKSIQ